MIGEVDFNKDMDFWQVDKWSGFFPVKWHIIKDIPNTQLRHIILENNDNRPVTFTRDSQEVLPLIFFFFSFEAYYCKSTYITVGSLLDLCLKFIVLSVFFISLYFPIEISWILTSSLLSDSHWLIVKVLFSQKHVLSIFLVYCVGGRSTL